MKIIFMLFIGYVVVECALGLLFILLVWRGNRNCKKKLDEGYRDGWARRLPRRTDEPYRLGWDLGQAARKAMTDRVPSE